MLEKLNLAVVATRGHESEKDNKGELKVGRTPEPRSPQKCPTPENSGPEILSSIFCVQSLKSLVTDHQNVMFGTSLT
jgi:hypothetical protein